MSFATRLLIVSAAGLLVGCGARVRPNTPPPPPPTAAVAPFAGPVGTEVPLVADPIAELIARVEKEFASGREEWDRDRLGAAREHFDKAVDLLAHGQGRRAIQSAVERRARAPARPDQRARCHGPARGRRIHRVEVGTGGHRRAAERRHVRDADAPGDDRRNGGARSRTAAARRPDSDAIRRCSRTSSSSRAACTTSFKPGWIAGSATCR